MNIIVSGIYQNFFENPSEAVRRQIDVKEISVLFDNCYARNALKIGTARFLSG